MKLQAIFIGYFVSLIAILTHEYTYPITVALHIVNLYLLVWGYDLINQKSRDELRCAPETTAQHGGENE